MSEIITFSRYFPEWHRKAGLPTYFVEKILNSLPDRAQILSDQFLPEIVNDLELGLEEPKFHTIRSGIRFKAGDPFSPRVWLGEPYVSKQTIFAPKIEVKQTWSFDCDENGIISINGFAIDESVKQELAKNDGLSMEDFQEWLVWPCIKSGNPFHGQIICWSDGVSY